ncbi:MAG: DUF1640 domain-containing protein [Magnetococcales bacterium]|nr:DUF1640 domain-containing protein [Magnetococcales bacterium]
MPQAIVFDTHANVKQLTAVGFTEEQAEAQTRIIANLVDEQLATKRDLKELELTLKHDLTLRIGGMLTVCVAVIVLLVKLL